MNFLNDAYEVSGTGSEPLLDAAAMFARNTACELIDPRDLVIYSFMSVGDGESFPVAKIRPGDISARKILAPGPSGDSYFRPSKGTMGRVTRESLGSLGITEDLQDEILEQGFFFMHAPAGGKARILLAGGDFLSAFCRRIGVGKMEPGVNALRDVYLGSLMKNAKPFTALCRSAEDGRFAKLFSAFGEGYVTEDHYVLEDMRRHVKARFGRADTDAWRISHGASRVDYLFGGMTLRGTQVRKGVRFSFSDTGDSSYRLQPILKVGGCVSYVGEPSSRPHGKSGFDPAALVAGVDTSALDGVDGQFAEMAAPISDLGGTVAKLANKTRACAVMGAAPAAKIRERALDSEPGEESLFLDAALEFLQIGCLNRGMKEYAKDKLSAATGSVFKAYKAVM